MDGGRYRFVRGVNQRVKSGLLRGEDFNARPTLIRIKRQLFEHLNADRISRGLSTLGYDKLAARAGEAHCREMLVHGYTSHWNLQGYKPYHRFSALGGTDTVHENCASADASVDLYHSVEEVIGGVIEAHIAMLSEVPPEDGHRRNILNPAHTHVGIGLAFNSRALRMTQEFVQRYVALVPRPPATLPAGGGFTLRGRVLQPSHGVASVAVFYEPHPRPLSASELNRTGSYGLPAEVEYLFPVCGPGRHYADGSTGSITLKPGGGFVCPINFRRGRPGLYTICVWVKDSRGRDIPATNATVSVS